MGLTIPQATVIGGLANNVGNIASTIITNWNQRKLAEYSYDQERQMIAEQNAYNSPLEQMKRYQEAGLNPNLIYGNGQSSAGNQQGIARYNAPNLDAPKMDLSTIIPSLVQVMNQQKDIEVKEQSIQNQKEENYILKQKGNEAQQEYYSKLMDNIVKSELLGYNPGIILSGDELQDIRDSKMLRKESAEVEQEVQREGLLKLQKSFQSLNNKEKKYIFDNILPIQLEAEQYKRDILKSNKTSAEAEAAFVEKLKNVGLSSGAVGVILKLLRMLIPGFSFSHKF